MSEFKPKLKEIEKRVRLVVELVNKHIAPQLKAIEDKIRDKLSIEDLHDIQVTNDAMIADIVEEIAGMKTMIHENVGEYPALVIDIDNSYRISKVYLDIDEESSTIIYSEQ